MEKDIQIDREAIVAKNLELMASNKDGGMVHVKNSESMGGNAHQYEGMPCLSVNFHYSPFGSVACFGNWQNIPKAIKDNFYEAGFRIASDINYNKRTSNEKIAEIYLLNTNSPKEADESLIETAKKWNKQKGSDFTPKIVRVSEQRRLDIDEDYLKKLEAKQIAYLNRK